LSFKKTKHSGCCEEDDKKTVDGIVLVLVVCSSGTEAPVRPRFLPASPVQESQRPPPRHGR
jgi:hypothetical protein